jgi:hypothetical protein
MKPAANQALAAPTAQSSRIVFLRPSSFGGAIQASLFDVSNDEPKFIGVSSAKTRVVYDLPPGPHRLMVASEAADFMEAKLAPGKTYYAVVTPRMGAWKARFSLWPVKATSSNEFNFQNPDFAGWVKNGKVVENTPAGEQWFTANAADIRKKQTEYLAVWKQKSAQELAERTLDEQDGRNE